MMFALATLTANAQAAVRGTIKSINGNAIVLTTDAGADATLAIGDSTRILRLAPGQTDLKSASPIALSEIKAGDRVLALGSPGPENATAVTTLVVMKQSDIAERRQQEREEWRRGVGGIVQEVNASAGTISIANALAASGKPILVHVSATTIISRYSPDSVKFDDARPGTLPEIKPGDQLRARGEKNEDGTEFTAQAIVSGTFRQIAGTLLSADSGSGTITVMDLASKKPVTFKITTDSQLRRLPELMAQRLAMRMKSSATAPNGAASAHSAAAAATPTSSENQPHEAGQGRWHREAEGGGPGPDVQQMLARMPAMPVSDLQKGNAVMLVATEGSPASESKVIMLVAGVEPVLAAAPGGASAATILSPWNLGASSGGEASSE
jgi:hypothetical protein